VKKTLSFLLVCMLMLSAILPVAAVENEVTVVLDGQILEFDVPGRIIDGRTMVPLRKIFEAMGADVAYNADTNNAAAVKGSTMVSLTIGDPRIIINGVEKALDVPGLISDGWTLAPLRAVGEAFGGTVSWNGATRTATIVSPAPEPEPEPVTEDPVEITMQNMQGQWVRKGKAFPQAFLYPHAEMEFDGYTLKAVDVKNGGKMVYAIVKLDTKMSGNSITWLNTVYYTIVNGKVEKTWTAMPYTAPYVSGLTENTLEYCGTTIYTRTENAPLLAQCEAAVADYLG